MPRNIAWENTDEFCHIYTIYICVCIYVHEYTGLLYETIIVSVLFERWEVMLFNVLHCKLDIKMYSIFFNVISCAISIYQEDRLCHQIKKGRKTKILFVITPASPDSSGLNYLRYIISYFNEIILHIVAENKVCSVNPNISVQPSPIINMLLKIMSQSDGLSRGRDISASW